MNDKSLKILLGIIAVNPMLCRGILEQLSAYSKGSER